MELLAPTLKTICHTKERKEVHKVIDVCVAQRTHKLQFSSTSMGFPGGSADKESACNVGDLGLIPGLGRSPGEGNGYPLQYSGLENSMDCIVHGATKSQTGLNDFHFHARLAELDFFKYVRHSRNE